MATFKEIKKSINGSSSFRRTINYMQIDSSKGNTFKEIHGTVVGSGIPIAQKTKKNMDVNKIIRSERTGGMERVIIQTIKSQWGQQEAEDFINITRQGSSQNTFNVFKNAFKQVGLNKKVTRR